MAKITLCIDPGASQTKVVYKLSKNGNPNYLLMAPEIEQISPEKLEEYLSFRSAMSNPAPEREAYVNLDRQTVVVGSFATKFGHTDRIKEIKYENALYKILAVVGTITQREQLKPTKLSLDLSILLPWNEYSDRAKLRQKLTEYLTKFEFRGQVFSVDLTKFVCRPEGGGLAELLMCDKELSWQQSKQLGILMFGHRNTTALYFDNGELSGDSPLIGFSNFLDYVVEKTSGQNRETIASFLFKSLAANTHEKYDYLDLAQKSTYPVWSKSRFIKQLVNAKDLDLQELEIKEISEAINSASLRYWNIVENWLAQVFPKVLDLVLISGGASRYLQPDLEKYFNCQHCVELINTDSFCPTYIRTGEYESREDGEAFSPIVWGAGLEEDLETTFRLSATQKSEESLSYRLMDAYGMFNVLN